MRAVIIDDDVLNIDLIESFCKKYAACVEVVGSAESVEEGIDLVLETRPDLLFLDIELDNRTGFEVLQAIQRPDLMVIVISAYDKYAIQAVKVDVVDYLLKPVFIPEFMMAVEKCRQRFDKANNSLKPDHVQLALTIPGEPNMIAVHEKDHIIFLAVEDILHLESSGSYTHIVTIDNKKFVSSKPLKEYESRLPARLFLRVHHSHMINLKGIIKLERTRTGTIYLCNHTQIPISASRRNEVMARLIG